jgi:hypothetical protein
MMPGEETEKENTGNLAHTIDDEINPHDRKASSLKNFKYIFNI